jgi:O-antigen/teichoic acid export membrane protein
MTGPASAPLDRAPTELQRPAACGARSSGGSAGSSSPKSQPPGRGSSSASCSRTCDAARVRPGGHGTCIRRCATIFADPSLGSALIQRREISELDRSTVFWTNLGLGVLCTLVGVLSADAVAGFFSQPEVAPLFEVVSLNFTVNALSSTQIALLTRSMEWRTLEVRQVASVGAGSVLAVALAFAGFGAWAIVGQFLCTGVVSAILLWSISTWRPRFIFSLSSLTSLASFGFSLFFARILAT